MAETATQEPPATEQSGATESAEEMQARHRKEVAELQNKEMAMKKAAAKGSKAEQKAKKKQVEEEISRLLAELKLRHAAETTVAVTKDDKEEKAAPVVKASKSVKRREKKAQKEAEREQRIRDEQSATVSDRAEEDRRLEQKLVPLGLAVREIKPDGHCLYRAVADQLEGGGPDHIELRRMAARYMRAHAAEFLPFFLAETTAAGTATAPEEFEKYCEEVEGTAAWGGEMELGALARCLRRHVVVFSGELPEVEMGKEFEGNAGVGPSILLSFHRHAYGLGEHYNSVVRAAPPR